MFYAAIWLLSLIFCGLVFHVFGAAALYPKKQIVQILGMGVYILTVFLWMLSIILMSIGVLKSGLGPAWLFPAVLSWAIAFPCLCMVLLVIRKRLGLKIFIPLFLAAGISLWAAATYTNVKLAVNNDKMPVVIINDAFSLYKDPLDEARNAFPVYHEVLKRLASQEEDLYWAAQIVKSSPDSDAAKDFLTYNQPAISQVHKASAMPDYCFPKSCQDLLDKQILPHPKNIIRLCGMAAMHHAAKGEMRECMERLLDAKLFSDRVLSSPGGPYWTAAGLDCRLEAVKMLEACIYLSPMDAKGSPADYRSMRPYTNETIANTYFVEMAQDVYLISQHDLLREGFPRVLFELLFKEHQRMLLQEQFAQMHAMALLPCPEIDAAFRKFNTTRRKCFLDLINCGHRKETLYTGYRACLADDMESAALAVWSYRADHGKYPERTDDLVPAYILEIPPDPFSGNPLIMEFPEGGVSIKSVGAEPDLFEAAEFHMGTAYKKYRLNKRKKS
ncbi:hypothetical protein [Desulfatibacillum aliphaticivorans]|uniref:hypothetical protein n=1 Tax=Desulfatibacillum aliphaticivorans TaxID=218208 RepID=UPI00040F1A81|nr:hypothetical protein [Desulfatibacillum aliphaticivorans]